MPDAIEPFHLAVPQAQLDGLRRRLADARWPEPETVGDWSQGILLARVQALCARWQDGYDWRRCEAMLNGWGQHRTVLDGLGIHFLHIRSPEPDALPMLMTHGWPGSVVEFHKVVGPLTDPAGHGGDKRDAFHLVLPSLPGYGFSDKPAARAGAWSASPGRGQRSWSAWATGTGWRRAATGAAWSPPPSPRRSLPGAARFT